MKTQVTNNVIINWSHQMDSFYFSNLYFLSRCAYAALYFVYQAYGLMINLTTDLHKYDISLFEHDSRYPPGDQSSIPTLLLPNHKLV
jgi:hypothetical protein